VAKSYISDRQDRNYGFFVNTVSTAVCGLAIFSGLLIRVTHRYKYIQLCGLCIRTIGLGLVYHATKNPSDAVLVTSQVLVGTGGAISIISSYIGVQGSVPHQDMAIATAVLNLVSSLGSSITVAVSASVWNTQVPKNLQRYLGDTHNATQIATIFGSVYTARMSEPRPLVQQGECMNLETPSVGRKRLMTQAYLESTRSLFLAGLIVSFGSIISALFARNFYLTHAHNAVEPHKVIKFFHNDGAEERASDLVEGRKPQE